jgi:hypothetical protein
VEVEEENVRLQVAYQFQGFTTLVGLADDLENPRPRG